MCECHTTTATYLVREYANVQRTRSSTVLAVGLHESEDRLPIQCVCMCASIGNEQESLSLINMSGIYSLYPETNTTTSDTKDETAKKKRNRNPKRAPPSLPCRTPARFVFSFPFFSKRVFSFFFVRSIFSSFFVFSFYYSYTSIIFFFSTF